MTEDSGFFAPIPEEIRQATAAGSSDVAPDATADDWHTGAGEAAPATSEAAHGPTFMSASRNGWSELYRVEKHGRFRVLKALKSEYRGHRRYEELLRKEFEIGYSLSHPGICEVYEFYLHPQLGNVIEMEWLDACTLSAWLSRKRPRRARRMVAGQLCDALSYLHSRQIVHRDLKPSNILITHNGTRAKIIDFGLSDADSYIIQKGSGGTRSWAAPELLSGGAADCLADIWSLGKLLQVLLPGRKATARRCMAKDPARRYQDADAVKAALGRPDGLWAACAMIALAAVAVVVLSVTGRMHSAATGGDGMPEAGGITVESPAETVLQEAGGGKPYPAAPGNDTPCTESSSTDSAAERGDGGSSPAGVARNGGSRTGVSASADRAQNAGSKNAGTTAGKRSQEKGGGLSDPAVIDELFRQATELVGGGD